MAGTPHSATTDLSISGVLAAGIGKYNVTFDLTLATLTDAAQLHITPGHKGRITKATFVTHTPATTGSKLSTLTPSIDGTDVTGGVLALNTVACNTRNKEVAGTAITALNSFTSTGTITWTGSSTTAFGEGTGVLIMELINDDTVEALAKALAGYRTP